MNNSQEFSFNFPCVIGTQGSTVFMLMSVPFRVLRRLLALDNSGHVLDRSQRELNPARVKKISKYLRDANTNKQPFILPPIIGTSDDNIEFIPSGVDGVGTARVPMDAVIALTDGQHRCNSIIQVASDVDGGNRIGLMLLLNVDLRQRQQFFSDINNNVSKPSAAINMAYNGRDELAQMMIETIKKHALLAEITDLEHNVVPARSQRLISFKALCDATGKFHRTGASESELTPEQVQAVWQSWINLTGAAELQHAVTPGEYRQNYIQFSAVMLNAFGYAVQQLLEQHEPDCVIDMVNTLAASADLQTREAYFLSTRWEGICVNTSKARPTLMANAAAQKMAAAELVSVLERGAL